MKHLGTYRTHIIFSLLIAVALTSCKPRLIFTESNRAHLDKENIDISRIQFFTDKEMIIRREISDSNTDVANGEIVQIDGENIVEIRIPRGTPGLVEKFDEGKIWVSFESCDECAIRFKRNKYDTYQVDADKWYEKKGEITYDGYTFYLIPPHNDALLMVKKREIYRDRKNSHIVRGRRINDKRKRNTDFRRTYRDDEEADEFEQYQGNPNWDEDPQWDDGSGTEWETTEDDPSSDISDQ